MANGFNSKEHKSKIVLNSSPNMESKNASLFQEKVIESNYATNTPKSRLTSIGNLIYLIKQHGLVEFRLSIDKAAVIIRKGIRNN